MSSPDSPSKPYTYYEEYNLTYKTTIQYWVQILPQSPILALVMRVKTFSRVTILDTRFSLKVLYLQICVVLIITKEDKY